VNIHHFFDPATSTLSYVVSDGATKDAVIIDPVLDFDAVNLAFSEGSMEAILAYVEAEGLKVHAILETHIHADHITGSHRLGAKLGAKLVASSAIPDIQSTFKDILSLEAQETDGGTFDVLMEDGDQLEFGSLTIEAIHTPGHTPACLTYKIGDAIFTGDTMFMPDFGTGRCDFPEGSASDLYDSIVNKLYTLPDATRVFVGHDYQPGGRDLAFETTIGAAKTANKQLKHDTSREDFIAWRTERDGKLNLPRLLFQSVQMNINAGQLPPAGSNGTRFLKIPVLGA